MKHKTFAFLLLVFAVRAMGNLMAQANVLALTKANFKVIRIISKTL